MMQDARNNPTLEPLIIPLCGSGIGGASPRALALRAINTQEFADISSTGILCYWVHCVSRKRQRKELQIAKNVSLVCVVDDPNDEDEDGNGKDVTIGNITISGNRFAFTRKLVSVQRRKASHIIRQAGGTVRDLMQKTDYLIFGSTLVKSCT